MTTPELQVERLGKASRRAGILSAVGAIAVAASLVYSWYTLHSLDAQIAAKKRQLANLTQSIEKLSFAQIDSQSRAFQLRASAKDLDTTNRAGDLNYTFSLYVQGGVEVLNRIAKVGYDRNHPTFPKPYIESTDSEHKFIVSWDGWGCLSDVGVTIFWKDNSSKRVSFDMCKSLGPEWE